MFDRIEDAIEAIGRGEIVVVADDSSRDEGDVIMDADAVTTERLAFFVGAPLA